MCCPAAFLALALLPAQDKVPTYKEQVRKLMPREQAAVIDQLEKCDEARKKVRQESNGLKKKELQADLEAEIQAAGQLFVKEAAAGIKGWVGRASVEDSRVRISDSNGLTFYFAYDGMPAACRKALRDLKSGSLVRIDVAPAPKNAKAPPLNRGAPIDRFAQLFLELNYPGPMLKAVTPVDK